MNNDDTNTFNELCYKVFFQNPQGVMILEMLEQNYFYQATAHPGKDTSWAFFNEGRNDLIRGLRDAGRDFMNQELKSEKAKQVKRERK